MRHARFLLPILAALTAAGCARHGQQAYYAIDPTTGQPVPVAQSYGGSGYATQQRYAQPQYSQTAYAQTQYAGAQPQYTSPTYAYRRVPAEPNSERGLFTSHRTAPTYAYQYAPQGNAQATYAQPAYRQPYARTPTVMQYRPAVQPGPKSVSATPYAYAPANTPYTLDSGDKLRVVVFGQDGISGSYLVDAGGHVTLPLIGSVPARGYTTKALSQMIAERLRQGYVRDPHVTVSIEVYRPFFILGEVTTPGQYPYVPNMTVENAVAVAGGFSPRAYKDTVKITRNIDGRQTNATVPLSYRLKPGDTVVVKERWF